MTTKFLFRVSIVHVHVSPQSNLCRWTRTVEESGPDLWNSCDLQNHNFSTWKHGMTHLSVVSSVESFGQAVIFPGLTKPSIEIHGSANFNSLGLSTMDHGGSCADPSRSLMDATGHELACVVRPQAIAVQRHRVCLKRSRGWRTRDRKVFHRISWTLCLTSERKVSFAHERDASARKTFRSRV